ncbi:hypothetical protein Agub_g7361 [Astrephomene gubernaculifera]|uniref:Globin n=1 Tax=Astrephomene gubernaculifera TaxID=47775 RepID=A0AAD3HMM6_9CHLO|nr:hypothetical protein Agub_g7361 [Astrephomene gubernaculifera]
MGGSCSHTVDAWAHLATTDEIRDAVKGIDAWQKAQEQNKASGGAQHAATSGPLLARVGGMDVVKRVVEAFYRKLYGNEKLLPFLHDRDIVYLRAKQSAFMSWLFGPPNVPYTGKHLRVAHLRIIKQRGFTPEDYELGMKYFEESMRELGAPEAIISEVLAKVRPFKDVIFTPCSRDAEEEARWAMEERLKEQAKEQAKEQELHKQTSRSSRSQLNTQVSSSQILMTSASRNMSRNISRNVSRGPQCPFSGGQVSGQFSAALVAGVAGATGDDVTGSCPVIAEEPGDELEATAAVAAAAAAQGSLTTRPARATGSYTSLGSQSKKSLTIACPASDAAINASDKAVLQLPVERIPSSQRMSAAIGTAVPRPSSGCPYAASSVTAAVPVVAASSLSATAAQTSSATTSWVPSAAPAVQPTLRSPGESSGGAASPAHSASSPASSRPASASSSFGVTAAAAAAVASEEARQALLDKSQQEGGLDSSTARPKRGVAESRSTDSGGDYAAEAAVAVSAVAAAGGGGGISGNRSGAVDVVDEFMSEVFGEGSTGTPDSTAAPASRVKAATSSGMSAPTAAAVVVPSKSRTVGGGVDSNSAPRVPPAAAVKQHRQTATGAIGGSVAAASKGRSTKPVAKKMF